MTDHIKLRVPFTYRMVGIQSRHQRAKPYVFIDTIETEIPMLSSKDADILAGQHYRFQSDPQPVFARNGTMLQPLVMPRRRQYDTRELTTLQTVEQALALVESGDEIYWDTHETDFVEASYCHWHKDEALSSASWSRLTSNGRRDTVKFRELHEDHYQADRAAMEKALPSWCFIDDLLYVPAVEWCWRVSKRPHHASSNLFHLDLTKPKPTLCRSDQLFRLDRQQAALSFCRTLDPQGRDGVQVIDRFEDYGLITCQFDDQQHSLNNLCAELLERCAGLGYEGFPWLPPQALQALSRLAMASDAIKSGKDPLPGEILAEAINLDASLQREQTHPLCENLANGLRRILEHPLLRHQVIEIEYPLVTPSDVLELSAIEI